MTTPVPAWYAVAQQLLGTKEIPGPSSSNTILGWAKALGGWVSRYFTDDSIPWCGLFVAFCIRSSVTDPIPNNPLGAKSWEFFGARQLRPRVGTIMVFSRPGGGGHIGFYAGENADSYLILGGNQSDKVCYTWVLKSRLISMRWPLSAPVIESGRVFYGRDRSIKTPGTDIYNAAPGSNPNPFAPVGTSETSVEDIVNAVEASPPVEAPPRKRTTSEKSRNNL